MNALTSLWKHFDPPPPPPPPRSRMISLHYGDTLVPSSLHECSHITMETLWFPFPTGKLSLHYGDILVPLPYRNALTSLWRHFGALPYRNALTSLWRRFGLPSLQECSHFTMQTLWSSFPTGMLSLHYGDTLIPLPYRNALTLLWRHFGDPASLQECSHFTMETLWYPLPT
jgi:hypothetical protein